VDPRFGVGKTMFLFENQTSICLWFKRVCVRPPRSTALHGHSAFHTILWTSQI